MTNFLLGLLIGVVATSIAAYLLAKTILHALRYPPEDKESGEWDRKI